MASPRTKIANPYLQVKADIIANFEPTLGDRHFPRKIAQRDDPHQDKKTDTLGNGQAID